MAFTLYALKAIDLAALKQADMLHVQLDATTQTYRVTATKEMRPSEKDPFARNIDHHIGAQVGMRHNWEVDATRAICAATVWLYHKTSPQTPELIIHHVLRVGDEIRFEFYPGARSNGYMRESGLVGDALYLQIYRKGKEIASVCLADSFTPANSARMCRNVFAKEEPKQALITAG